MERTCYILPAVTFDPKKYHTELAAFLIRRLNPSKLSTRSHGGTIGRSG